MGNEKPVSRHLVNWWHLSPEPPPGRTDADEEVVLASDYDALQQSLRDVQQRERKLREALTVLAAYPIEEFGKENKGDDYPLFGANQWELNVGHVRCARAALRSSDHIEGEAALAHGDPK